MKASNIFLAIILGSLITTPLFSQETFDIPTTASLSELEAYIQGVVSGVNADFGVYILHVESGEELAINGDRQYDLASVFKIPVLLTLYKLIDDGYYSLDDRIVLTEQMKTYGSGLLPAMKAGLNLSINDLQLLMVAVSDNTATDILFDLVGSDRIAAYMSELGLGKTIIDLNTNRLILGYLGLDMDERLTINELFRVPEEFWISEERKQRMAQFDSELHDVSTPKEIGSLLSKLVKGEIVSPETSQQILSTLRHHTGARLITRFLPFGISVARKGGSLGRDWKQTVLNDSGIIFLPEDKGHVIVCAFSNELESPWYEFEIAAGKISRAAYNYFTREVQD